MVSTGPLSFLAARTLFVFHLRTSLSYCHVIGKIALVSVVDLIKYYIATEGNISEQQIKY